MKLLIVEDNIQLARDMKQFLTDSGFIVELAATYQEASEKLSIYNYDLTIIDLGLPDGNGLDLIQEIKANHFECAILILTARDVIEDKVCLLYTSPSPRD